MAMSTAIIQHEAMRQQRKNMNKETTLSDVKRAILSKGFVFGVLGMVLIIVLSSIETIFRLSYSEGLVPNGYHAHFIMEALASDWFTLALPILCALPFTAAFVDDIKSGYIKPYLHRTTINSYIKAKLTACALSGGLVLFVGVVLCYALSALVFTPMEFALMEDQMAQPWLAQFLIKAVTLLFSGAFWSLLGFTFAAMTMSKYMAYASPFIIYYVLIILNERYFGDLYVLYPKEWLFPSNAWVLGGFGVIILQMVLCAILCLVFAHIAQRRIANV